MGTGTETGGTGAGGEAGGLLDALQKGSPAERIRGVRELRERGTGGVELLCRALRDGFPSVRVEAARALGEIGDERAVGPLIEALQRSFAGHSARRQAAVGVLIALSIVVVPAALVLGALALGNAGLIILVSLLLFGFELPYLLLIGLPKVLGEALAEYLGKRRAEGALCVAYMEALAGIAERHPTPELRRVLPELEAVTVDVLQQERRTRAASRETARRIEALTAELKDLPLPAAPASEDPGLLPRPSERPRLPHARGE